MLINVDCQYQLDEIYSLTVTVNKRYILTTQHVLAYT